MADRLAMLPAALRNLEERVQRPGVVPEVISFCGYHGEQRGAHCAACDEALGINRAALENEARIRALAAELRALGVNVGPIKSLGDADPAPNEAKEVMTPEERRAALLAELEALGGS